MDEKTKMVRIEGGDKFGGTLPAGIPSPPHEPMSACESKPTREHVVVAINLRLEGWADTGEVNLDFIHAHVCKRLEGLNITATAGYPGGPVALELVRMEGKGRVRPEFPYRRNPKAVRVAKARDFEALLDFVDSVVAAKPSPTFGAISAYIDARWQEEYAGSLTSEDYELVIALAKRQLQQQAMITEVVNEIRTGSGTGGYDYYRAKG